MKKKLGKKLKSIPQYLRNNRMRILLVIGWILVLMGLASWVYRNQDSNTVYELILNLLAEIFGIGVTVFIVDWLLRRNERIKEKRLTVSILNRILRLTKERMWEVRKDIQTDNATGEKFDEIKEKYPEIYQDYRYLGDYGYEAELLFHQEYYIEKHIHSLADDVETHDEYREKTKPIQMRIEQYQQQLRDEIDSFGERLPLHVLEVLEELPVTIDLFLDMCAWYGGFNEGTYEDVLRKNLDLSYIVAKELGLIKYEIEIRGRT